MAKTWMITGVSSGFGREMTEQLLSAGDRVIGTVRSTAKVADLIKKYPDTFDCVILDVTDAAKVTETVNEAAAKHGRIDVYVSNAGYGLSLSVKITFATLSVLHGVVKHAIFAGVYR